MKNVPERLPLPHPSCLPAPPFAHPGHGNEGSFLSGFLHPIGGA